MWTRLCKRRSTSARRPKNDAGVSGLAFYDVDRLGENPDLRRIVERHAHSPRRASLFFDRMLSNCHNRLLVSVCAELEASPRALANRRGAADGNDPAAVAASHRS